MSEEIHAAKDEDAGLFVTSYFGGVDRGQRLQFTVTGESSWWAQHVTLGYTGVEALATSLNQWLQDRAKAVVRESINGKLDALAKRFDAGEFTNLQYLAEITRVVGGDA